MCVFRLSAITTLLLLVHVSSLSAIQFTGIDFLFGELLSLVLCESDSFRSQSLALLFRFFFVSNSLLLSRYWYPLLFSSYASIVIIALSLFLRSVNSFNHFFY